MAAILSRPQYVNIIQQSDAIYYTGHTSLINSRQTDTAADILGIIRIWYLSSDMKATSDSFYNEFMSS